MEVAMHVIFSSAMLRSIENRISEARAKGGILDVYKTAETIRLANIDDNVAREDIIEKIVLLAGSNIPLEFNKRAYESETNGHLNGQASGTIVEFIYVEGAAVH
jgi:hypothetical protein